MTEDLVGVVQALSLARTLPTVMQIVRRAARELVHADGATLVLRDGGFCHYADENAIGPLWKGQRFPIDARVPHAAYRPTFVKSLVMVPIRTVEPIGAIGTYWARLRHAPAEDVKLLAALAGSTSIAIENVGLYESFERRVAERGLPAS